MPRGSKKSGLASSQHGQSASGTSGKKRKRSKQGGDSSHNSSGKSNGGGKHKPKYLTTAEFDRWQKRRFDPVEQFVKRHSVLIQNFPLFDVGGKSKLMDVVKGFFADVLKMPGFEIGLITDARRLSPKTVRVEFSRPDLAEKCLKHYRVELRKSGLKFSGPHGAPLDPVALMADRTEQQVKVNVELQKVLARLRRQAGFRKVWQHDLNQIGVTFAGKPEGAPALIRPWKRIQDEISELRTKKPEFFEPAEASAVSADTVMAVKASVPAGTVSADSSMESDLGPARSEAQPEANQGHNETVPYAATAPLGEPVSQSTPMVGGRGAARGGVGHQYGRGAATPKRVTSRLTS